MTTINCHECGHGINMHYVALGCRSRLPQECMCFLAPSDIAEALLANPRDEYHTMDELYRYRMLYNALLANLLADLGRPVHKSWRHATGEECFGGGWFIVTMQLPTGQVSNHYKAEHWDLFRVPEQELADEWDGHTPEVAADRMERAARGDW